MLHRLLFAGVLVMIIWLCLLSNTASSQQIESRFNNLQADFNRVNLRLNQIELQLNQGSQLSSPRTSITVPPGRNLSSQERMFDRLATLVVELKQQVSKLEQRVSQLESP